MPVAVDREAAVDDDEHLVARLALAHQDPAGGTSTSSTRRAICSNFALAQPSKRGST
jgi:hypothetical protein